MFDFENPVTKVIELLEPISKVFSFIMDFVTNPIEYIMQGLEFSLMYFPMLCVVIFIFYIVTGSPKILRVFIFTIMLFIYAKWAIVFEMVLLLVIFAIASILIIFLGRVM